MIEKEWIGKYVEVWIDPRSTHSGEFNVLSPQGILKAVSPTYLIIEDDFGTTVVLMAHVVTIWKAKETA